MGGVNGYLEGVGTPAWEMVLVGKGKEVVFEGCLKLLQVSAVTVLWYEGRGGVEKRMVWGGGLCEEECGTGGGRVVWVWGGVCYGDEGVGCPKLAMASLWGDAPDRGCSRGVVVGVMWGGGWRGEWVM